MRIEYHVRNSRSGLRLKTEANKGSTESVSCINKYVKERDRAARSRLLGNRMKQACFYPTPYIHTSVIQPGHPATSRVGPSPNKYSVRETLIDRNAIDHPIM